MQSVKSHLCTKSKQLDASILVTSPYKRLNPNDQQLRADQDNKTNYVVSMTITTNNRLSNIKSHVAKIWPSVQDLKHQDGTHHFYAMAQKVISKMSLTYLLISK